MLHNQTQRGRLSVWTLIVLPVLLGGIVFALLVVGGAEAGENYIADTGAVQSATLTMLLFAALSALIMAWRHPENRFNFLLLACGLGIYAGREHDLHRLEFLAENFTKWQFYTMPIVPLWQKICFGTIMALIACTIVLFVVRMLPQIMTDLKLRARWTMLGMIWLATLIISQIADHSWLNETYSGRAFEETTELVAAAFAVLVVWNFPRLPAKLSPPSRSISGKVSRETAPANAS